MFMYASGVAGNQEERGVLFFLRKSGKEREFFERKMEERGVWSSGLAIENRELKTPTEDRPSS